MCKSCFTLLFVLPVFLFGFTCEEHFQLGQPSEVDQVLCRDAYVIGFDYYTKNPAWSIAYMTKESVIITRKRVNSFAEDREIPSEYRAKLADYKGSHFDRGHLFPNAAGDYTEESQKETFLLSNMAPQRKFNRNGWRYLEEWVRDAVVVEGEGFVITGLIYDYGDMPMQTIGKNKVLVPTHFYKVVYLPYSHRAYAYLMPNVDKIPKAQINNYVTSVDELERITGADFLSELPDELEDSIEEEVNAL